MKKALKKIKKYIVEIVILIIAVLTALISLFIFLNSSSPVIETTTYKEPVPEKIYVDVSGSVKNPGLYQASNNIKLDDIIKKAGGLSNEADKGYFARNFNLARTVYDQEKIYIPSLWEVQNGYLQDSSPINNQESDINNSLININSATLEELDTLPGVGEITAKKIIDNRPFRALEELISKKIVSKTAFENIKNLIKI